MRNEKEVCIMKKVTLLSLMIPFFCLIAHFPVPAHAVDRTPGEVIQGTTDPYSVTLYEGKNYSKPFGTWKLAPGMRMLKLPTIGRPCGSILVGSSVSVVLFYDWHFKSHKHLLHHYDWNPIEKIRTNEIYALVPFVLFKSSSPIMFPDPRWYPDRNPLRYSIIIHRKDIGDWLGVGLQCGRTDDGTSSYQFYPLPEKASEKAIIYSKIPYGNNCPYTLTLTPGSGCYGTPWPNKHPNQNDIEVTATGAEGNTHKFPDANDKDCKTTYDLGKHGINQPSSLKIVYKGPFNEIAYKYSARVVAPKAPTTAKVTTPTAQVSIASTGKQAASIAKAALIRIYNVSGLWKSNIGVTYTITQQQNTFQWTVANSTEKGNGTINGYDVTASWQGPQGGGSSPGKIATVDGSSIAWKELGVPITNTTMLGALIKCSNVVKLESVKGPVDHRFGRIAGKNLAAMKRAYDEVKLN